MMLIIQNNKKKALNGLQIGAANLYLQMYAMCKTKGFVWAMLFL